MTIVSSDRVSRPFDVLVAAIGLVVLSPLMLLIAVAILIESPGPVFFAQTRIGKNGRLFRIFKLRKFHPDIGSKTMPLTLRNDNRMTRIGAFLALTKLDELPQLYNILRGDMAFVGPRPESLDFVDCFTGFHKRVLDYTPGMFGPSQVAFRDEASYFPPLDQERFYRDVLFPLKATTDLAYYPNRSLLSDLGWIVRGVLAVAGWGHGATGIVNHRLVSASGERSQPTE